LTNLSNSKKQRTLNKVLSFSGVGVFTGEEVTMRLYPAPIDHGIVFQRVDLPFQPLIPASLDYVKPSSRCTMLTNKEASVQTVEHLLAALRAFEIDNVLIEISGPEVPILDGSAAAFVTQLALAQKEGHISTLDAVKPIYRLSYPIYWSRGDVHLIALPSEEYRISYTIDYPHFSLIGSQYFSLVLNEHTFTKEIASCRTFCLYEEVAPMIEKGWLKEVSLENGIVINEKGVMNPEGLRFANELVRHKILDLIGDLALTGIYINAHIIAIKSGHAANHIFGLELLKFLNQVKGENSQ